MMNSFYARSKFIFACFAFLILITSNAHNFTKRKYYHFKKGNNKLILKAVSIKKNNPKFSSIKDSIPQIITTEINQKMESPVINSINIPIRKTERNVIAKKITPPIQQKCDVGFKNKQQAVIPATSKSQLKLGDKKLKNFFIVLLFTIAVVAVFTLIIWGLIWLANLSLLGLIAAITLGIFLVLWPIAIIIDFIWGHGISGIH